MLLWNHTPLINRASEILSTTQSRETLEELLDELEFLFEALEPELQDLATQFIEQCTNRPNSK